MSINIQRDIERQVGRVRRRMIAQELVRGLAVGVAGGLLTTTGWLLAAPFVSKDLPTFTNRAVLGGALALGGIYAVARAMRRRPTTAKSALWLDSEFKLGERVTTSLALSATDAATPAGEAVLNDTHDRVKSLRVRDRFPVRIDRAAWLVPSSAAVLALVALFYDPALPVAQGTTESKPLALADKAEIEKKLEALAKPKRDPVVEQNRPKSEELKQLEAKLEEIARQPRENTQQLRERVKDMTPLEDEIKKLERQRSEKSKMLQQQLQMKDQLLPSNSANDGPAKDFMKALSEGDMDKGREELEKLTKRIAKNELSEKEKEQLGQQMKQLEKKMSALAQQKQKEELLKKLGQDGKLDPEALERELAQLKKENENLKDLKKLAEKMGECQQCVKSGDLKGAEKAMGQAADQLKEMARDNQELNDLREALQGLQEAKDSLAKACDQCDNPALGGNGNSPGEGDSQRQLMDDRVMTSDFGQGAGRGAGRRPDGEQGKTRSYDAKQDAKMNPKGQKQFDGFVPGQAYKKKAGVDLATDIRQAAQDAPEAIETQRIPKAARDIAKGYFKNLGGQADGEKKEEKKKAD